MRVLEALHVIPGQCCLERRAFRRASAPGLDEAPEKISLAPAVHCDVYCQAEGAEAVVLRAPHPVVDPSIVAAHIELKDTHVLRRRGGLLEAGLADRREHLRHTGL